MNSSLGDYLAFRRMITPIFIQVIFWIVVAVIVIAAFIQMANDEVAAGLLLLILGPLGARIYAEILIVIFQINNSVAAIRGAKVGRTAAEPPPPAPVAPPPA